VLSFLRKKQDGVITSHQVQTWFEDRYQMVLVQRNILLLFLVFALVSVLFAIISVTQIATSKTLEPFIIEIEDKTGITTMVRPYDREYFSSNDALRRYFLMKYLTAREAYNAFDYHYNYYTIVRLLSAGDVYSVFRRSVSSDNPNSPISFGDKLQRNLKIKSITFLPPPPRTGKEGSQYRPSITAQMRYIIVETGSRGGEKHRIATINFDFYDLKMTQEERFVNPLGFQVTGFRVDEEVPE
jgi:type IV secretion system protein VirB8